MILKARDAGKERFKKERMQERRDPRKKGCRKGGMKERRDERKEGGGTGGNRKEGIQDMWYTVCSRHMYSIMKILRFSGFRYKERKTNF